MSKMSAARLAPVDAALGDDEIVDAAAAILGLGVARTKSEAGTVADVTAAADAAATTVKASADTRAKSVQCSAAAARRGARLTRAVCVLLVVVSGGCVDWRGWRRLAGEDRPEVSSRRPAGAVGRAAAPECRQL